MKKFRQKIREKTEVAQDKDIKDREGTQPASYYKGLKKSTKTARARHFEKGKKMDDDNPAAYKKAPGDSRAKTKLSKHTLKYRKMYGEEKYDSTPGGHEWGTDKGTKYMKKKTPKEKVSEAKYSVDVEGIPRFYVDADSHAQVKVALRKILKKATMIKDVERVNQAKIKQDYRERITGKHEDE